MVIAVKGHPVEVIVDDLFLQRTGTIKKYRVKAAFPVNIPICHALVQHRLFHPGEKAAVFFGEPVRRFLHFLAGSAVAETVLRRKLHRRVKVNAGSQGAVHLYLDAVPFHDDGGRVKVSLRNSIPHRFNLFRHRLDIVFIGGIVSDGNRLGVQSHLLRYREEEGLHLVQIRPGGNVLFVIGNRVLVYRQSFDFGPLRPRVRATQLGNIQSHIALIAESPGLVVLNGDGWQFSFRNIMHSPSVR